MLENNDQELEISLTGIIKLLLRKWLFIVLFAVLGGILAAGYVYYTFEDNYVSQSSMIVQVSSPTDIEYTDLLYGERLIETYVEITESNKVLDTVIEKLNLDISKSKLKSMITVSSKSNSLIINIMVKGEDAIMTSNIANEIVNTVNIIGVEFHGLEEIEILDVSVPPTSPVSNNAILYISASILFGIIISSSIIIGLELSNNNIKTPKDVEEILGLRLLGIVPEHDLLEGGS